MTAYPTLFSKKGEPFYLIQAHEPDFFPDDPQQAIKSKATYSLPMTKLCVSQWLLKKLGGNFVGNGVNLNKFKNLNLERTYDVMLIPRKGPTKGIYDGVIENLRQQGLKLFVAGNYRLGESELVQAYNQSKAFLYLSESEGFGYPPLEAMACGTPVITTPCIEYGQDYKNVLLLNKKSDVRRNHRKNKKFTRQHHTL
jgi:hypothetical protein